MESSLIKEDDLAPDIKKLWLKALSAFELRNFDYAISLLGTVVEREPAFLEARKALRKAGVHKKKGEKKLIKLSGGGISSMKIQGLIKKDAAAAMAECERALVKDPYNIATNQALFDASQAAGFPEIATFALETIREGHPDNTKNLHQLAEHLLRQDMAEDAVKIYDDIVKRDATDMDAVKGGKDASARASMAKQKWDANSSMKELMVDSDEAQALERKNRAAMTNDQLLALRDDLAAQYEERSGELTYARELADVNERLEDLPSAIQWYQYAITLSDGDPNLQRKVEILSDRAGDVEVKQLRERAEAATDPGEKKELEDQLKGIVSERSAKLVEDARMRKDRNPTDKQLRFELGQHLFNAGEFKEAIPELQQARSNPHLRIRAMLILGKCFEENNMLDMAAQEFQGAASELTSMDEMKKEVLYALGCVLEKMDRKEESLDAFKQIYNADYGYRDVAKRVEASYDS